MESNKSPDLMQSLSGRMRYLTERQKVLATNIAHIDTPGYKAKDLKKVDFSTLATQEAHRLNLATTSPKHFDGGRSSGIHKSEVERSPYEIAPNGNSVVLEDQMAKVSDTTAQYEISSSLYKKFTMMYRSVLGQR